MDFFLGIDAGGSTCRARLVDAAGAVLGSGRAGPANVRIGVERAFAAMREAWTAALAEAGVPADRAGSIRAGIGVAGISRPGARAGLLAQPFPFRTVAIDNDAVIAHLGAHAGRDGATVIVGTGSIGIVSLHGRHVTMGGYGFPISDEGSGADIGLNAIRRSLLAHDGRGPAGALTGEILARFEDDPARIVAWMDGATPTDYATLAPLVVRHAAAGDTVADAILEEAGRAVSALVAALLDRGAPRACLVGGLAPTIQPRLASAVRARIGPADGDPLAGAVILARQREDA